MRGPHVCSSILNYCSLTKIYYCVTFESSSYNGKVIPFCILFSFHRFQGFLFAFLPLKYQEQEKRKQTDMRVVYLSQKMSSNLFHFPSFIHKLFKNQRNYEHSKFLLEIIVIVLTLIAEYVLSQICMSKEQSVIKLQNKSNENQPI